MYALGVGESLRVFGGSHPVEKHTLWRKQRRLLNSDLTHLDYVNRPTTYRFSVRIVVPLMVKPIS